VAREIALVLLACVSPISELRGGIPLGILRYGLNPILIFLVAVVVNGLVFFPIFFILLLLYDKLLYRIPLFDRYLANLRKRGKPMVDRHGFWGLFAFVAVPLPLTGAYTGTILAWLLGMRWRKAFPPIALGVLVAGGIVLLITLLIEAGIISIPWILPAS
jgi:uncharacterized membrane protein